MEKILYRREYLCEKALHPGVLIVEAKAEG